jgi:bifunctional oligoribonuclease and PAP phosphatase NrnA
LDDIIRFIQAHQRFAITSHARPDGDAIGSSLGLSLALQQLGKTTHVFSADPHPHRYGFLPALETIRVTNRVEGNYDGLFVLECNNLNRTGLKGLERYHALNIDHHPDTEPFGDLNWLDPGAAAVGEMIYYLIRRLSVPLTAEIATNLYVAIMTDTGSFQFSNTHARTFQIASDLTSNGANASDIAQSVYMNQPQSGIRLLGMLLETLELHSHGKIASITLTQQMLQKTGASANDVEGIVNYPLSVAGVLLAAFFREEKKTQYRVSLRSKGHYDVAAVAHSFGGGGHKNAAGLLLEGNYDETRDRLISELEKLLD